MKYLVKWKIFESSSSGNDTFNWISKKNENYFKLEEILENDVFDDFGITKKPDDFFFEAGEEDNWPTHKFWTYRVKSSKSVLEDTANFEKIGDGKQIDYIIIYNITHQEHDKLAEALEGIKDRVKSYIGSDLVWGTEEIDSAPGFIIYDFILRLK